MPTNTPITPGKMPRPTWGAAERVSQHDAGVARVPRAGSGRSGGVALGLLLLVGLASGCGETTIDGWPEVVAVLNGRITTASGAPVPGATVNIRSFPRAPCGPLSSGVFQQTVTDSAGTVFTRMGTAPESSVVMACVAVTVVPPAGSGLRDSTVTSDRPIRFAEAKPGVVLDTLRLDISLSAAP